MSFADAIGPMWDIYVKQLYHNPDHFTKTLLMCQTGHTAFGPIELCFCMTISSHLGNSYKW